MAGWIKIDDEALEELVKWGSEAADPHVIGAMRTEQNTAQIVRIAIRQALWMLLGNGMVMIGRKPDQIMLDGPIE